MAKQSKRSAEEQQEFDVLREYFHDDYADKERKKLNFLDAMRHKKDFDQWFEARVQKKLEKDFKRGVLQKKMTAELELQDQIKATGMSEEALSEFKFDSLEDKLAYAQGETLELAEKKQISYNVMLPLPERVLALSDAEFTGYALDMLHAYDMNRSEIEGIRKLPAPMHGYRPEPGAPMIFPKGNIFVKFLKKDFNLVSAPNGLEKAPLAAGQSDEMTILYGDKEEGMVNTAEKVIDAFSKTGKVPFELRRDLILYYAEDTLNDAPYAKTNGYMDYCDDVMNQIASRIHDYGVKAGFIQPSLGVYATGWRPTSGTFSMSITMPVEKPAEEQKAVPAAEEKDKKAAAPAPKPPAEPK